MSFVKNDGLAGARVRIVLLLALGASALTLQPRCQVSGQPPTDSLGASAGAAFTKAAVPKKAKTLLLAAARVNGLEGPGMKPWHILVEYERFDWLGGTAETGAYEEWWMAPNQYRISYRSPSFTQTEYGTAGGVYRTGNPGWPGVLPTRIRDEVVRPMFRELDLQFARAARQPRGQAERQLSCVRLEPRGPKDARLNEGFLERDMAKFCFEPDSLILRLSKGSSVRGSLTEKFYYQRIIQFQDRYVAGEVHVARSDRPFLKLEVKKLEPIEQPDAALLTPPPDAMRIDDKPISPDVRVLRLDYLVYYESPDTGILPNRRVYWTVAPQPFPFPDEYMFPGPVPCVIKPGFVDPAVTICLQYTITREGRVKAVRSVGGSGKDRDMYEEPLKKRIYRPFLLRGEPVELEVTEGVPKPLVATTDAPDGARENAPR
jgi:hypothetical protein